jgi:hypothetical protein
MGRDLTENPTVAVSVFLSRFDGGFDGTVVGRIDDLLSARLAEDSVISDVAPGDRIPESGGGGGDGLVFHCGGSVDRIGMGRNNFLQFFLQPGFGAGFTGGNEGLGSD